MPVLLFSKILLQILLLLFNAYSYNILYCTYMVHHTFGSILHTLKILFQVHSNCVKKGGKDLYFILLASLCFRKIGLKHVSREQGSIVI